MPKQKHLYIFIGGSKRAVGNHVLGFGEGWCADTAYGNMLAKDPYQRGVPAHGWRLADSAEAIPVGDKKPSTTRYCKCGCGCGAILPARYRGKYASRECATKDKRRQINAKHR